MEAREPAIASALLEDAVALSSHVVSSVHVHLGPRRDYGDGDPWWWSRELIGPRQADEPEGSPRPVRKYALSERINLTTTSNKAQKSTFCEHTGAVSRSVRLSR